MGGGSGGYAPGDYDMWFNGTSCAPPYAAGAAAAIDEVLRECHSLAVYAMKAPDTS